MHKEIEHRRTHVMNLTNTILIDLLTGEEGFHLLHQSEQVLHSSWEKCFPLRPTKSTQASFVSFGTRIASIHCIKQRVNNL